MANRPNPLLPVIVNVSSLGVNMPTDYTRVFTVASFGDSEMQAGELMQITKSTITDAKIKADSYTERFINSYFANNSQGALNVLELKESASTPHIHTYLISDYYVNEGTTKKALQEDKATSETDYKPAHFDEEAYWETTTEIKKYSIGDYYIDLTNKKEYIALKEDSAKSITDLTPTKITNGNFWKEAESEVTLERAITILKDFVASQKNRSYEIACPSEFYKQDSFIELVKSYSGLTDGQYFSIELPDGTNPAVDTTFTKYAASKSFIPVYPSPDASESSNGAVMGIKASSKYDLGSTNPLSLLQWKTVYGITPQESLSNTLQTALNQSGCTWVGSFNKNTVIMGGQVGDGKNWEFYFALDTYIFKLISEVGAMMIQASNNPNIAIHFNQAGINIVGKKLEAISNNLLSFGVLEEFGSSYDTTTNAIQNAGSWNITSYAEYKSASYDKWQKGIYDGASAFATIGNFILQVSINLTIE